MKLIYILAFHQKGELKISSVTASSQSASISGEMSTTLFFFFFRDFNMPCYFKTIEFSPQMCPIENTKGNVAKKKKKEKGGGGKNKTIYIYIILFFISLGFFAY